MRLYGTVRKWVGGMWVVVLAFLYFFFIIEERMGENGLAGAVFV